MIASLAAGRDIRMLPGNGCPGPVAFEAGRLRLISIDTQWWLHEFIVRDDKSTCNTSVAGVTQSLRQLVESIQPGRVVIATGHHPLMTGGEHGGYCGITGPFRRLGGNAQDILSGLNRTMRDSLEAAFRGKPPLLYAAGHDHNLQVMKGAPSVQYLAVSGAGSEDKAACAVYLRESYYVSQHRSGFMNVTVWFVSSNLRGFLCSRRFLIGSSSGLRQLRNYAKAFIPDDSDGAQMIAETTERRLIKW